MIAHCYNEIINHYDISTQEKLGGDKLRQQPHAVANPTKAEHAHQAQKQMASQTLEKPGQPPMCCRSGIRIMVIGSPAHTCWEPINHTGIEENVKT